MGKLNVKEAVQSLELQAFMRSLLEDLRTLDEMIKSGAIESDITRIGAEQELCMIDEFWRPAPVIESVLPRIRDPHFTTELAKFNLEFNLDPMEFNGDCLSKLETEIHAALAKACKAVRMMRGDVILCGILPTIRNMDLELDNMTPMPRYKALFNSLRRMRGGPFEYHILGKDELIFKQDYPSFEFCNTSFQIHYQVSPAQFIDTYNFSKLITAPVLAVATNSPLLSWKTAVARNPHRAVPASHRYAKYVASFAQGRSLGCPFPISGCAIPFWKFFRMMYRDSVCCCGCRGKILGYLQKWRNTGTYGIAYF
ncbi:MAG: hypothetical protein R3C26_00870 [Calditrichia bacterium]